VAESEVIQIPVLGGLVIGALLCREGSACREPENEDDRYVVVAAPAALGEVAS
jgi:hypothetical protein